MFLLYSVYDAARDKEVVLSLLDGLLEAEQAQLNNDKKEGRNHG